MTVPISPWLDEAELASPDGRSLARFYDGHEIAMGAPCCGRLSVRTPTGERVISRNAGASMVWSEDSRFLAFTEGTKDRSQTVFVCRTSDFAIDWLPEFCSVIELHRFKDGWITGVNSPVSYPEPFAIEYRKAKFAPKRRRDRAWWASASRRTFAVFMTGALLDAAALVGMAFTGGSTRLLLLATSGGIMAIGGFCGYQLAERKLRQLPPSEPERGEGTAP